MQDGSTGAVLTDMAADRTAVVTTPVSHRAATAETTYVAAMEIDQRPRAFLSFGTSGCCLRPRYEAGNTADCAARINSPGDDADS